MRVIAAERLQYRGVYQEAGEEFDCEDAHGELLCKIGRARRAALQADDKAEKKGRYKRADLRAED